MAHSAHKPAKHSGEGLGGEAGRKMYTQLGNRVGDIPRVHRKCQLGGTQPPHLQEGLTRRGGRSQITHLPTITQWPPTATGVKSTPSFRASRPLPTPPIAFALHSSCLGLPTQLHWDPTASHFPPHASEYPFHFSESLTFQFSLLTRKRTP